MIQCSESHLASTVYIRKKFLICTSASHYHSLCASPREHENIKLMVRRVELKVIFTFILYKPANFALTVLFTTHSMSFLFMLFWTIGLIFLPLSYLHLLHVLLFPPVSIRSYSTVQLNLFPRTVAYFGACNLQHPLVSLVFALIWSLSSRFFPCFELNPLFSPTLSCKPDSSPSSFA